VRKGSKTVRQVKVRWSNSDPEACTWENPDELHQRFSCMSWEQDAIQGGRDVTHVASRSDRRSTTKAQHEGHAPRLEELAMGLRASTSGDCHHA
jgi:P pilus assembly chaperone PapD